MVRDLIRERLGSENIFNKYPEILHDVELYKIILMPLELYLLKLFLYYKRPMNIREVYTECLFTIFDLAFIKSNVEFHNLVKNQIIGAGYGIVAFLSNKECEDILK